MEKALLLGGLDRGTIQTTLKSNKYERKTKILKSLPANWKQICKILENDEKHEMLVLGKLTEYVLFLCCNPDYTDVSQKLFNLISRKKHILFVYNENLFGTFSSMIETYQHEPGLIFDELAPPNARRRCTLQTELERWIMQRGQFFEPNEYSLKMSSFLKELNTSKWNVVPYRTLLDIELTGQNFIESHGQGLLFRIYVPINKLWSNEIDKILSLFREYTSNVIGKEINLTQNRTDKGTTFSLYSANKNIDSAELRPLFDDFTSFLDICSKDPSQAYNLLYQSNLPKERVNAVLSKYVKESKRMLLDLNQERELKLLGIKHRLESELTDLNLQNDINHFLSDLIPEPKPSSILYEGDRGLFTKGDTIINIKPQYINNVKGIVASEINGEMDYTPEDTQLMNIMEKYASDKAELTRLKSSLNELKDKALPKNARTTAWQHLQSFLSKTGNIIGDVGVHLLKKYLEQQMFN